VIRISGNDATVQDLGSRNGVHVNGERALQERVLKDGDRIRLGTQELVFYIPKDQSTATRTTGYMRVCDKCGVPYPDQAPQCPHCGNGGIIEEETLSGVFFGAQRSWTFDLLGEVIERALRVGRVADAEKVLRRAGNEIDERLAHGDRLEPRQTEVAIGYAISIAKKNGDVQWLRWLLGVHRAQSILVSAALIDALEAKVWTGDDAKAAVAGYLAWARPQFGAGGKATLDRLEAAAT
jgi:hypothetical protein